MAEIDNEADGGDSPATLKSAADSLAGGYTPYDGFPVAKVKKELAALIGKRGNARAERFVTGADFAARKRGREPKAAKKPAKKAREDLRIRDDGRSLLPPRCRSLLGLHPQADRRIERDLDE